VTLRLAVRQLVKQLVKIDGKERPALVEIDGAEGERTVRVDGLPVDVTVAEGGPGIWILRRGAEQTIAQVDGRGGKLAVEIRRPGRDAVLVAAEVTDGRRATVVATARSQAAAAPITVRSPIPGRLIKLLVKTGDAVTAGQTLVVLEAMKMENELAAPRAGRVAEIRCAEGGAVEAGQDLVVVS